MSRQLVFVRHGQSEGNAVGSLHSLAPGSPLTALGHREAAALVDTLGGLDIRSVWASTMTRAQQTAAPLAAARGLQVQVLDGVREAYLGTLHDRRDAEAHEQFEDVMAAWTVGGDPDLDCAGGESASDVITRYLAAVDKVLADLDGGTAVIVSHGAATRLSVARLAGVDAAFVLRHHLPNTGYVVVDEVDGEWVCTQWNGLVPP